MVRLNLFLKHATRASLTMCILHKINKKLALNEICRCEFYIFL